MTHKGTMLWGYVLGILLLPAVATAQNSVTQTDIQRLQDQVYQVSADISRIRGSDTDASRLQAELDELRDEVAYLKVRLRREGRVPRAQYIEVRDRLQELRSQAGAGTSDERRGNWGSSGTGTSSGTGSASGGTYSGAPSTTGRGDRQRSQSNSAIPAGQEIDVELQTRLSSDTAQVEDRFQATTAVDLVRGNDVLIPAGSVLRGVVRTVDKATRTDRRGQLTVAFDQITVRGRTYPIRGTVTQALESDGMKGEAARIGAGAGVGAVIGGILGGAKGALLGVLIGGGGTIAATEGRDVTLEPGTILRVRLDSPPEIR